MSTRKQHKKIMQAIRRQKALEAAIQRVAEPLIETMLAAHRAEENAATPPFPSGTCRIVVDFDPSADIRTRDACS